MHDTEQQDRPGDQAFPARGNEFSDRKGERHDQQENREGYH